MDSNEYQARTADTELYSVASKEFTLQPQWQQLTWLQIAYCTGKLNGEAGELAEYVFKAFRGDAGRINDETAMKIMKELGDIQWYLARIADLLGYTLDTVMRSNLEKLADRKERGIVHGYGDER